MDTDRRSRQTVRSKTSKASKKSRASIIKAQTEYMTKLAQPKPVFKPPPAPKKKHKPLEEMKAHLDVLASPKEFTIPKIKELGKVNPHALAYEITQPIMKLAAAIPKRYTEKIEVIMPGQVKASALRAKPTERLEKLATPKTQRETKQAADDEVDPWIISPNALKYKPTARILELAKPVERE